MKKSVSTYFMDLPAFRHAFQLITQAKKKFTSAQPPPPGRAPAPAPMVPVAPSGPSAEESKLRNEVNRLRKELEDTKLLLSAAEQSSRK